MKKNLIISLLVAFILSLCATAFAANPFIDVPAKHWAYDAIGKLAQAGIIDGYGDGTFKGDRTITRYEMAQIVAKSIARSDKATVEQKAIIDKLAVEFSSELNSLGVRLAALEKKNADDRVNFSGLYRMRYDDVNSDGLHLHQFYNLLQIDAKAAINDNWTAGMRWEAYKNNYNDMGTGQSANVSGPNDGHYDITRAYVTGSIGSSAVTVGKFTNTIGSGMTFDAAASGAAVKFGNELKVTLAAAQADSQAPSYWKMNKNPNTRLQTFNNKVYYANLNYNFSKTTSAVASYQVWQDTLGTNNIWSNVNLAQAYGIANSYAGPDNRIWDVGFNVKINSDWTAMLKYAKSSMATDNRSWMAGVQYKSANIATPGSWDVFANYMDFQFNTCTANYTFDAWNIGVKQYEIGFDYVPAKNMKFKTWYINGKAYANNNLGLNSTGTGLAVAAGQHVNFVRAQVEYFF